MLATICSVALVSLAPRYAHGFDGHRVTEGDLTVFVEELPTIAERHMPQAVIVRLTNAGEEAIAGTAGIRDMVDDSWVVGLAERAFECAPGGEAVLRFRIAFGAGTYSAMYPVHVHVKARQSDRELAAHAIRIVTTDFAAVDESFDQPTPMQELAVPEQGALPLQPTGRQRPAWQPLDGPVTYKPSGWTGRDATSNAHFALHTVTRGSAARALSMHPPWTPLGSVYCDYLLRLPDVTPLGLTFGIAIRDSTPPEPVSDGVLFRAWALEPPGLGKPDLLFERFTDAKVWKNGDADLSPYRGQTILLRFESHPGPAQSPYCDASFWGDPTVVAGDAEQPVRAGFAEAARAVEARGRAILEGGEGPDGIHSFMLGEGSGRIAAMLSPGERGLADGVLSFVGRDSAVSFDGFDIEIMGQPAVRPPTPIIVRGYQARRSDGRAQHVHRLEIDGRPVELTLSVWAEGDGLRIGFRCNERITDFALGNANRALEAVYYGHGYRIVRPEAFVAHFGGHDLSTSHIGCDYAGGMSLLQAVDVPPDTLQVDPTTRHCSLHTHLDGRLTLLPGERGALDCAVRYRPLYDKRAAGGVKRLAGRFCLDIWGGRYAEIAERMEQMIRYGLTDSILTVHVWQRWGYDYRLPDIWPPDPRLGTIEGMRRIGEVCRAHDIPWGLHDDYVCIFPDAGGYSYDLVRFSEAGQPLKHWYTESRDAQSWAFRADKIMPFVQRNLRWIKAGVAPTHYFLDVFTSEAPLDYYDREGRSHPATETRAKWGEVFAWIRDHLGDNAPTTSEAGHDQLIGWLDGADCQHLRLTEEATRFGLARPCADWERVPWYDAVNHARFILHGVGYSDRYQGGRDRRQHGINSDDYISDEILLGHALMVDQGCWGAPAVRKYWLAQGVARNLARRAITEVKMAGGDMHRPIVKWDNGTTVHVNRGVSDWRVAGRTLPQYGYVAEGEGLVSAIEKRDGVYCESSIGPDTWYCSARRYDPERCYRIAPRVEGFRYLGGRRFTYEMVWDAREPAPRDMSVYVHFYGEGVQPDRRIPFQDDHRPEPSTSQWSGTVRYSRTTEVPQDASGDYVVAWGIYDEAGILRLMGPAPSVGVGTPVWIGTLHVQRNGEGVANITLSPPTPTTEVEPERTNLDGKPVDFGFAVTDGAFRVEKVPTGLRLTPLPDHPPFAVTLRPAALGLEAGRAGELIAEDQAGNRSPASCHQDGDLFTFRHDGRSFRYELRWGR